MLPSLGESDVVFATTATWCRACTSPPRTRPTSRGIKGSLAMLDVLAAAVADRQRLPEDPLPVTVGGVGLQIDDETAAWARDEARASGRPHNEARAVFADIVTYVLTERAMGRIGRGWLTRDDRKAWDQLRTELLRELANDDAFAAALDALWPVLDPETLLAELYTSRARLRAAGADPSLWRAVGRAWTVFDVPLLDELVDLLGRDPTARGRPGRRAGPARRRPSSPPP